MEPTCRGGSNENSQATFLSRNKKNNVFVMGIVLRTSRNNPEKFSLVYWLDIPREKWLKYSENSGDPDHTPHSAAPDLGLRCLPIIF